ncbi:MAG: type VI secretion system accessory protein TagJ [Gammaproteobacteria bacterium]
MSISAAEQHLKDGRLDEALSHLQVQIRQAPQDPKLRVFLFQLLALSGQWDRALNQLNVCGELDSANLAMVQTYREAIRCEILRNKVFAGETSPLIFGQPEQWLADLLVAIKLSAHGQYSEAVELRQKAFDEAPATSGTINEQAFQWIADADSRLGPVLEVIVNGRYYWVPFCRISKITLEPPTDLRDLVWLPAQLIWSNGGGSVGLIPSRYPDSELCADFLLRLARKTEWLEAANGEFHGVGQRMLATNVDDYSLFDIRELVFQTEPS